MKNETAGALLTIWVIWFALMTGVFVMYFVIGHAEAKAAADNSLIGLMPLSAVVIATVIRWALLPRARRFPALLQLFIIGMALSEGTCIIGLFVFPAEVKTLFPLGVVSMLQFIPLYARSQIEGE